MEPLNNLLDPGPNVLLTASPPEIILRRLRWGLGRFEGYVGINNHMGSLFTSNIVGMQVVMRELKRRGLLFLDSRTSGKTIGAAIAKEYGVPVTQRNIFLDNINSPIFITDGGYYLYNFIIPQSPLLNDKVLIAL